MKDPILYTNYKSISNELKDVILNHCFDVEILEEIRDILDSSNADCDGENSFLLSEISKILKAEDDVLNHLNVD